MIADPEIRALKDALRPVAYLVATDDLQTGGGPVILEDHRNAPAIEALHFAPGFPVRIPGRVQARSGIRHIDRDPRGPEIRLAIGPDVRQLRMVIPHREQGVAAGHGGGGKPVGDAAAVIPDDGDEPELSLGLDGELGRVLLSGIRPA